MSPNMFFGLPRDILSSIYEYDNTYKKMFSDNVVKLIWGKALKRSLKSFSLPKDSLINGSDDTYDNDVGGQLDIEKGTDAVKFAAGYMFRIMGFFDNYSKGKCQYGIGNDFCIDELSAVCIQLYDYVYDDSSVKDDKFTKRSYIAVRLYIKKVLIFDGGVYQDICESEINDMNNDNDSILIVHHENGNALFQYIN